MGDDSSSSQEQGDDNLTFGFLPPHLFQEGEELTSNKFQVKNFKEVATENKKILIGLPNHPCTYHVEFSNRNKLIECHYVKGDILKPFLPWEPIKELAHVSLHIPVHRGAKDGSNKIADVVLGMVVVLDKEEKAPRAGVISMIFDTSTPRIQMNFCAIYGTLDDPKFDYNEKRTIYTRKITEVFWMPDIAKKWAKGKEFQLQAKKNDRPKGNILNTVCEWIAKPEEEREEETIAFIEKRVKEWVQNKNAQLLKGKKADDSVELEDEAKVLEAVMEKYIDYSLAREIQTKKQIQKKQRKQREKRR